jgi:hypothetical protein
MRRRLTGIVMATIASFGVVAWAQQGQPRPGPGSGVVSVQGVVNVGNTPSVRQDGEWRIAVANTPAVTIANSPVVSVSPPPFVRVGARYQIVWSSGETEQVAAASVGPDTWVRVAGPERWINLAQARSISALP